MGYKLDIKIIGKEKHALLPDGSTRMIENMNDNTLDDLRRKCEIQDVEQRFDTLVEELSSDSIGSKDYDAKYSEMRVLECRMRTLTAIRPGRHNYSGLEEFSTIGRGKF